MMQFFQTKVKRLKMFNIWCWGLEKLNWSSKFVTRTMCLRPIVYNGREWLDEDWTDVRCVQANYYFIYCIKKMSGSYCIVMEIKQTKPMYNVYHLDIKILVAIDRLLLFGRSSYMFIDWYQDPNCDRSDC